MIILHNLLPLDDDDIATAATCLLRSCTPQVTMSIMQKEKRQRSTWVHIYLQKRNQYGVYTTLLPDLADYHKEKFWNFGQMDLETFEVLFKLAAGLMLSVRAWRPALKTVV